MKILKAGKVEQRKFVCPDCGCVFAESKQKLCELSYGFRITCPQKDCDYEFTDDGEPYEEPTPLPDGHVKARLMEITDEWNRFHFGGVGACADFLMEKGVTVMEDSV